MGEIIRMKIRGMNWKSKVCLILIFTMVFSTFMYEGWYGPREAKAAVSLVGVSTPVFNTTAANPTTLTMTEPNGSVGDLLILHVNHRYDATGYSFTAGGTGWSQLVQTPNGTTDGQMIFWKVATATTGATVTISINTSGANGRSGGSIHRYSGVDTSAAPAFTTATGTTTASAVTATGLTTTVANTWIVTLMGYYGTTTIANPSGMTANYASANTTNGPNISSAYQNIASAGATGNKASTSSLASWIAHMVALKPAAAIVSPTVTSTSPNTRARGSAQTTVTITGTGFQSGATVSFNDVNITTGAVTVSNATTIQVPVTVGASATLGGHNVTVTNTDTGTGTGTNVFTVTAAPTVTSTSPSSRGQGVTSQNITITGTGFQSGATASFSGTGITVNSTTFNSATQLTANITITAGATTGARNVTVTNTDGGVGTGTGVFTVTAAPTVTSTSPNSMTQGTGPTTVSIIGAGFQSGATVAFSGTGITLGAVSFVNANQVTVPVTVAAGAATGARNVTVTNTDGGVGTGTGVFTVTATPTCTANQPTLSIAPTAKQVVKGGETTYSVTVTNNDTAACGSTTFSVSILSDNNSTDFNASALNPTSHLLTPGASGSSTLTVSAKATATVGSVNITTVGASATGHTPPANVTATTTVANIIPILHNSITTGSTKWGPNGWGIQGGKYGEIVCATCHTENTGNIKRINQTITAPNAPAENFPGSAVVFSRTSGTHTDTGLFGLDARVDGTTLNPTPRTSSNRVCEVCHTYDALRANGVNAHPYATTDTLTNHQGSDAGDCITCHKHKDGFKAAGCDGCHGNPPILATAGGPSGLANNPYLTGSTIAGAHARHATQLGYTCVTCHNGYTMPEPTTVPALAGKGNISLGFSAFGITTGSYTGQTTASYSLNGGPHFAGSGTKACSNLYCHGNFGGNGNNASPAWDGTAVCGSCHDVDTSAAMNGGSHDTHVRGTLLLTCNYCHEGTAVNAAGGIVTPALHVNGSLDWNLLITNNRIGPNGTYRGTETGTRTTAQVGTLPYGQCSGIYCHSNVQTSPPGGALTYKIPTWGGAVNCGDCHKAGPAGGALEQDTGSHLKHVSATQYHIACAQCHQNAGSGTPNHANAQVNVLINTTWGGSYSGTTTPGDAYGTCSNVYCHSTVQGTTGTGAGTDVPRAWGTAGPLGCAGCHKNMASDATATGSHAQHVQSTAAYTCDICHGANYTNTTVSGTAIDTHSNKVINLSFTGTQASGTTYVTKGNSIVPGSAAYSTCTTSNCHGTVSPTWGANTGATQCEKCHGSATTAAAGTFEITAGTTNTAASVIHVSHLNSTHNYSSNIACAQCHTEPAAVNDAGHIDNALPAEVPMAGALARTGGLIPNYVSGTKTCSNMYCHGKSLTSNNPTPPASTDVDPAWTATFLGVASVVGNGNNTPGSGDCAKCHAYPPMNGPTGTHTGKTAANCIECHTHVNAAGTGFGDVTKHINGTVDGGTCNSCHGYESTSWITAPQLAIEGKGAHEKHVNHLVALRALTIPGFALNPNTDKFGAGDSWTYVCGICHNGAVHQNSTTRQISILSSYQFGASAPSYSGIPATSSSVNPKSCSSVSCHFTATPVWSAY